MIKVRFFLGAIGVNWASAHAVKREECEEDYYDSQKIKSLNPKRQNNMIPLFFATAVAHVRGSGCRG